MELGLPAGRRVRVRQESRQLCVEFTPGASSPRIQKAWESKEEK